MKCAISSLFLIAFVLYVDGNPCGCNSGSQPLKPVPGPPGHHHHASEKSETYEANEKSKKAVANPHGYAASEYEKDMSGSSQSGKYSNGHSSAEFENKQNSEHEHGKHVAAGHNGFSKSEFEKNGSESSQKGKFRNGASSGQFERNQESENERSEHISAGHNGFLKSQYEKNENDFSESGRIQNGPNSINYHKNQEIDTENSKHISIGKSGLSETEMMEKARMQGISLEEYKRKMQLGNRGHSNYMTSGSSGMSRAFGSSEESSEESGELIRKARLQGISVEDYKRRMQLEKRRPSKHMTSGSSAMSRSFGSSEESSEESGELIRKAGLQGISVEDYKRRMQLEKRRPSKHMTSGSSAMSRSFGSSEESSEESGELIRKAGLQGISVQDYKRKMQLEKRRPSEHILSSGNSGMSGTFGSSNENVQLIQKARPQGMSSEELYKRRLGADSMKSGITESAITKQEKNFNGVSLSEYDTKPGHPIKVHPISGYPIGGQYSTKSEYENQENQSIQKSGYRNGLTSADYLNAQESGMEKAKHISQGPNSFTKSEYENQDSQSVQSGSFNNGLSSSKFLNMQKSDRERAEHVSAGRNGFSKTDYEKEQNALSHNSVSKSPCGNKLSSSTSEYDREEMRHTKVHGGLPRDCGKEIGPQCGKPIPEHPSGCKCECGKPDCRGECGKPCKCKPPTPCAC